MTLPEAERDGTDLNSEINMIPLIDVMLVLLIVFIVTVPVLTHTLPVQLPRASAQPAAAAGPAVRLSIDAQGQWLWDGTPLPETERQPRLQALAQQHPQPELHLQADAAVRFEAVAQALAAAQHAGITQLVFVTQPGAASGGGHTGAAAR